MLRLAPLLCTAFAVVPTLFASVEPVLWFDQPARTGSPDATSDADPIFRVAKGRGGGNGSPFMNEALPVGNGRLGALVFGGTDLERLVVNEISLWSGDQNPDGNYDTMGSYETLGNVWLQLPGARDVTDYLRQLDLATATAGVTYTSAGVRFTREIIASAPANVIAWRLTADRPGQLTGHLAWQDAHAAPTVVTGREILAAGALPNGLRFATGILLVPVGGQVVADGNGLAFRDCDELLVLISGATDYAMDHAKGYRSGIDPAATVRTDLAAAATLGWDKLRATQLADYQRLFQRVRLDLGPADSARRALPVDQRRLAAATSADPEMDALLFHYGRYLLISCSRPGSLPANLQGLWNDVVNPAWHSDYHTNINVQMNYWPAETANLAELHTPLFALILSQIEPWRKATFASPEFKPTATATPALGWAVRTSHNIFGGGGWKWDKTANVWYAHHFWEHYAFGRDREWLRTVAWPLMRELAEFWLSRLKPLPDGTLVVPNGWSPEHGPTEDGVAYSQQKLWNHFTNCLDALTVLGGEEDLRRRLVHARDHLLAPRVGSWGQLLEWSTEKARPAFLLDDRWREKGPAALAGFIAAATKNPRSPAGLVWSRFDSDRRRQLTADPGDVPGFLAGLNALVQGPDLLDEPGLAAGAPPILADLQRRAAATPSLLPWINWCVLVRAAGLTGIVALEDTPLDTHRHTSHLFGVYPGRQITPDLTPALAEAARVSLLARGDTGNVTEWAFAWRAALFARLRDGEAAHRQLRGFLRTTCPNLFGNHPPMQIDGNFGVTAAIAEMLVQSHAGPVELLPALPAAWSTGSAAGLRARGAISVDLAWKDHRLTSATFLSPRGGQIPVVWQGRRATLTLPPGKPVTWSPPLAAR